MSASNWTLASSDNTLKMDLEMNGTSLIGTLTYERISYVVSGQWAASGAGGTSRAASAFALSGDNGSMNRVYIVATGTMIGSGADPIRIYIQVSTASSLNGDRHQYKGVLRREPQAVPTIDLYFRPRLNQAGKIVGFKIEYDNSDDRHVLKIGGCPLTLQLHNESGLPNYTWVSGDAPTIHGTAEPFIRNSWPFVPPPQYSSGNGYSHFTPADDGLSATYTNTIRRDTSSSRRITSPPQGLGLTCAPAHYQYGIHVSIPQAKLPVQLRPNATRQIPANSGNYYYTYAEDPEIYVDECWARRRRGP